MLSAMGESRPACSLQSCMHALTSALPPHLYALPVGICAPHVPQDGVHGAAVVKLLLKLVRITYTQAKKRLSTLQWA